MPSIVAEDDHQEVVDRAVLDDVAAVDEFLAELQVGIVNDGGLGAGAW